MFKKNKGCEYCRDCEDISSIECSNGKITVGIGYVSRQLKILFWGNAIDTMPENPIGIDINYCPMCGRRIKI